MNLGNPFRIFLDELNLSGTELILDQGKTVLQEVRTDPGDERSSNLRMGIMVDIIRVPSRALPLPG